VVDTSCTGVTPFTGWDRVTRRIRGEFDTGTDRTGYNFVENKVVNLCGSVVVDLSETTKVGGIIEVESCVNLHDGASRRGWFLGIPGNGDLRNAPLIEEGCPIRRLWVEGQGETEVLFGDCTNGGSNDATYLDDVPCDFGNKVRGDTDRNIGGLQGGDREISTILRGHSGSLATGTPSTTRPVIAGRHHCGGSSTRRTVTVVETTCQSTESLDRPKSIRMER